MTYFSNRWLISFWQALTKLGVKLTARANECTHLLVPQLVRTEKFLCAMAVGPFILKEDWALDSASSKRILRMFSPMQ